MAHSGCLLGAMAGDAAGFTLKFFSQPITHVDVVNSMKMPGGGAYNVGVGEVSDAFNKKTIFVPFY
jgi:hypothetical protein